jgi:Na+-transporting methylmalonyl-CoA/oxaloacetate decarboxylase gamma subunit
MATPISLVLQITLIGMGLVFLAIILLWFIMMLMVRLTATPKKEEIISQEADLKRRAAIAAVSVALAHQANTVPREFPLPPTALVSAWQAVMRSRMLNKRGPVR